jgi:mannose-1-phosphate guanylyltransferase
MMHSGGSKWAMVLAAGEGSRLRSLTTNETGQPVPKQFCSLRGGDSLLGETLSRAESIVDHERVCTVVASLHRQWWKQPLSYYSSENTIVQPSNRGTGNGILLGLLNILMRDPHANVLILPSDHYVRDEAILAASMRLAMKLIEEDPTPILLLGIQPEEVDSELGYIVPGPARGSRLSLVSHFVEKPSIPVARLLCDRGALWNSFIMVANAAALVSLISSQFSNIVTGMRCAILEDDRPLVKDAAIVQFYRHLPMLDFSAQVLQNAEAALRVVRVKQCGWSDLGTPKRIADTLRRYPTSSLLQRGFRGAYAALDISSQPALRQVPVGEPACAAALHAAHQ